MSGRRQEIERVIASAWYGTALVLGARAAFVFSGGRMFGGAICAGASLAFLLRERSERP